MENTITYQAGNGAQIKIEVREYLDEAIVHASIDGKMQTMSKPAMLTPPKKVGDVTVVAHIGNIGLTQERLDMVQQMIGALQAEINARPAVQLRKLTAQRNLLAENIGHIIDAAHEDHMRYIEQASEHGFAKRGARDYETEEQAARAALAEFDAAHPEVIAKIEADKAERIANFLAND